MKLWSIQTEEAWTALQKAGWLSGSADYVDEFMSSRAYDWMRRQMRIRIGPPPHPGAFPVWAWRQWNGLRESRPDLRAVGHLPKGTRGVRLALEVDPDRVLFSDFELWHFVLNGHYLAASEADDHEFDRKMAARGLERPCDIDVSHPALYREVVASWERIFDVDAPLSPLGGSMRRRSIQACLWRVDLGQVFGVTPFVAR